MKPLGRDQGQAPLAGGFLVLLVIAMASVWLAAVNRNQSRLVAHTLEVQTSAARVLNAVEDAETGQRGWLLTHELSYLDPYSNGVARAPAAVETLARLTADNPRQQATITRLRRRVGEKLVELSTTLALSRDAGDFAGALAIMRTGRGQAAMRGVRQAVGEIQAEEARMLAGRQAAAAGTAQWLLALSLGGIVGVIALAVVAIRGFQYTNRELRDREAELKAANDGLEGLVARRTAELTESNEEIQRYAYIVSHDLRAPLVNVMGFTSELRTVRDEVAVELKNSPRAGVILADFEEALGYIQSAINKMENLIGAILKISREGRRAFLAEDLDMTALVQSLVDAQHHQAQALGAEIQVDSLPHIRADRLAVEQIFANLVDNALKYLAPDRSGRIEVTGVAKGPLVCFQVRDNGRGIAQSDFTRVFELFRRSGAQDRPGEGIGLAHVKALVRSLGGRIELESIFGVGTTFTVWLPIAPTPDPIQVLSA